MKRITTLIAAIFIGGCATPQLPKNVMLSADGKFVDRMIFEKKTEQQADAAYGHLKTCIAEHVNNEGVELSDSSGSFFGAATGNYYQVDNTRTTQGGQAIQTADDNTRTIIAKGVIPFAGGPMIPVGQYLKFTMRATAEDNSLKIAMSQIAVAQESTGNISNRGFSPLGVYPGSPADSAYAAADQLSAAIGNCVNQ